MKKQYLQFTLVLIFALAMGLPVFGMGNAPATTATGGAKMEGSSTANQSLSVTEDTWVYAFRPDRNYGNGGGWKDITNPDEPVTLPKMFLGFGGEDKKIVLLKFDLSSLAEGKTINKAEVLVYNDFAGSDAAINVAAKRITSSWDEMKVTYRSQPKTGPVLSTTSLRGSIGYKQEGKWYRFDVTDAVNSWQAGSPNYGIMLDPEGESGVDFDLVAREYKGKAEFSPRLEISY
jgi:hypothetical protein